MTASVPDGISFDELQSMMEDAAKREPEEDCTLCASRRAIEEAAEISLKSAIEIVHDPMVHKVMMLDILSQMVDWHTKIGESFMADDCTEAGVSWLRDAGKFQSMMGVYSALRLETTIGLCINNSHYAP